MKIIMLASNQTIRVVFIICTITLLIFSGIMVLYFINTSNYVKTEAKIIRTFSKKSRSSSAKEYFVTYEYSYNNKIYTIDKQVIAISVEMGETIYIKCNPNNPQDIMDSSFIKVCIFIIVFMCLMVIMLGRILLR